jgi:hypothetical protein
MNRKKWIIGSLVGTIIVFAWQALSWTAIVVHDKQMKYTPAQDEILALLNSKITDEGLYSMPSGATEKEAMDRAEQNEGKPWASIIYHKEYHMKMGMRLTRAFLIDLVLVISLIYVLTRGGAVPIARRVFSGAVAWGLAFFLAGEYMGHNWFDLPWHMIGPNLIDNLVSWSICGIWLGWWMNRK